ncbi:MAG: type IV pili methyl-accepting chemotaxis transducer N-terminal domain-containing protein [Nitrosomonadales bacterium]|nr:type IV pili methyl-accepting chemotaxis transducer N-terminal domain-containing protein [Nitrosomonadales bacterium]
MTVATRLRPPQVDIKQVNAETFNALINLAGRQRMLSQRIILNAILAAQGHEAAIDVARQALSLFEASHQDLVIGNQKLPGIFFDALEDIYHGSTQADKKIRAFIHEAHQVIENISVTKGTFAVEALGREATPLVNLLNQVTTVYETEAKRHAQVQQKQYKDLMGNIQQIAKHARIVSVNAQIMAARAGEAGKEFSVVAGVLSGITEEIDKLIVSAMASSPH